MYFFVVMSHLDSCLPIPALDIESYIFFAAVEDSFVASRVFCNEVEGLDEFDAKFLALLVCGNRDIFDVANGSKIMDADSY